MSNNELLLAMSEMMDKKLEAIKNEVHNTKLLIENDVLPRLNTIESCYTSTYRRYSSGIDELEALSTDVSIMKKVIMEHSEKLQKIS